MSTHSPAMDALIAVSTAANDGSDDGTSDDHEEDKSTETGASNEEKDDDDEATDEEEMDCIDDSFRTAQSALTEYSSKDSATAHLDPNEHARVNDPILRPVKKHRKKENYPFGGSANIEASDVDAGETQIATTTNEQAPVDFSDSILSRLFMPDRMQRRELWEFVRLVAPGPTDSPPPGQYKWRSKDAIAAYCVKCKMSFTYTPGTSKTVSRHLVAHHGLPDPSSSSKAKRRLLKPPPPRTIAKDVPDEESFDEESLRPRKKSKAVARRVLPSKESPRSGKSTAHGSAETTIDTSFSSRDTAKTLPVQHQGGNNARADKIARDLFHWMIASYQTPSRHRGNILYSNTNKAESLTAPSLFVDFCRNLDDSFEMPSLEVMESLTNAAHEKLSNEIKLRASELFPPNSASDTDSSSNQEFISISVRRVKVARTTGYGDMANTSIGHGAGDKASSEDRGGNKEDEQLIVGKGEESRNPGTKRAANRQETFYPVRITFCTPTFRLKSYVAAVIPGDDDDENEELFVPYFRAVERTLSMYGLPEENVTRVVIRGEISNADSRGDEIEERADLSEIPKRESICLLERLDRTVMNTLDFFIGTSTSFQDILDTIEGDQGTQSTRRMEDTQEAYSILSRAASLPSGSDRKSVNQVLKIIKPFHDAIQTLSVDSHPTIGLAIPIIRRVRDLLVVQQKRQGKEVQEGDVTTSGEEEEDNVSHVAPLFCRAILKEFKIKFSLFLQENPPLMWTMLLDPRLIVMRGLSKEEQNHAKSMLIEEVTQLVHIIDQNEGEQKLRAADRSRQGANSDSSSPMNTMGGIFWGEELDQADSASRSHSSANFVRNADDYAKKNVESYFNTVQSQRHIKNPLLWWKNNQNQFPELAILARKWICSSVIYGRPNTRDNESTKTIAVNEDTGKIRRSIFLHDNIDLIYRKGFQN